MIPCLIASRSYMVCSIGTSSWASPRTRASCVVRNRIAEPTVIPDAPTWAASAKAAKSPTPMPPKRLVRDISQRVLRGASAAGRPNLLAATSRVALSARSRKVTTVSPSPSLQPPWLQRPRLQRPRLQRPRPSYNAQGYNRSPRPCQDRGGPYGQRLRSGDCNVDRDEAQCMTLPVSCQIQTRRLSGVPYIAILLYAARVVVDRLKGVRELAGDGRMRRPAKHASLLVTNYVIYISLPKYKIHTSLARETAYINTSSP
jgi:hypothetical protein